MMGKLVSGAWTNSCLHFGRGGKTSLEQLKRDLPIVQFPLILHGGIKLRTSYSTSLRKSKNDITLQQSRVTLIQERSFEYYIGQWVTSNNCTNAGEEMKEWHMLLRESHLQQIPNWKNNPPCPIENLTILWRKKKTSFSFFNNR